MVTVRAVGFVNDMRTSVNAFDNNTITLDQLILLASCNSQLCMISRPLAIKPWNYPSVVTMPSCLNLIQLGNQQW